MAPKRAAAKAPRAAAKPANNVSKNADIEDAHLQFSFGDDGPRAQAALLDWWDVGHREMPWRRELASTASVSAADREVWAYKVWVSEIMLQQTQVDRVVPYWEKWTTKWPDVASLAAASEDDVRAVWTGLGYYRRCAFLLEGAREVHASGSFPQTRDEWLKIKGVGAYTSAAISSIVFGDKTPVVDGNVIRILARLRACPELPTGRIGSKLWWLLAAEIVGVDCARPGDANQAMMEFGATLCTKANPKCNACPLQKQCEAGVRVALFAAAPLASGRGYAEAAAAGADGAAKRVSARYPAVAEKKASVRVDAVVCVLQTAASVEQPGPSQGQPRPAAGLWEGGSQGPRRGPWIADHRSLASRN
ncbi:DNA glycosylase [Pelagophyceae sp. CCMP2097]|nr:DNA glycosylase [Pelagophyceae sp. CCMP2097]